MDQQFVWIDSLVFLFHTIGCTTIGNNSLNFAQADHTLALAMLSQLHHLFPVYSPNRNSIQVLHLSTSLCCVVTWNCKKIAELYLNRQWHQFLRRYQLERSHRQGPNHGLSQDPSQDPSRTETVGLHRKDRAHSVQMEGMKLIEHLTERIWLGMATPITVALQHFESMIAALYASQMVLEDYKMQ